MFNQELGDTLKFFKKTFSNHSASLLCCMLKGNLPAWKHEYSRMALEGTSKNLCALDS